MRLSPLWWSISCVAASSEKRLKRIGVAPLRAGSCNSKFRPPKGMPDPIRALAETLRDELEKAKVLRSTLVKALVRPEIRTAFDVFGSDLPDEVFAGVFEQPRQWQWREINL